MESKVNGSSMPNVAVVEVGGAIYSSRRRLEEVIADNVCYIQYVE